MNDKGTYSGALSEVRDAFANVYYTALSSIGDTFISIGRALIEYAWGARISEDDNTKLDIILTMHNEWGGISLPTLGSHDTNPFPPPGVGKPVYYNDKGQLVYEDGERVLSDELHKRSG